MDKLLGIIRENGTLTAQVLRRKVAPDFESREAVAQTALTGEAWYKIVSLPFAALEPALFPNKALHQTPQPLVPVPHSVPYLQVSRLSFAVGPLK